MGQPKEADTVVYGNEIGVTGMRRGGMRRGGMSPVQRKRDELGGYKEKSLCNVVMYYSLCAKR